MDVPRIRDPGHDRQAFFVVPETHCRIDSSGSAGDDHSDGTSMSIADAIASSRARLEKAQAAIAKTDELLTRAGVDPERKLLSQLTYEPTDGPIRPGHTSAPRPMLMPHR